MNEGTCCLIKKTDYVISQHHVTTQQKCSCGDFLYFIYFHFYFVLFFCYILLTQTCRENIFSVLQHVVDSMTLPQLRPFCRMRTCERACLMMRTTG